MKNTITLIIVFFKIFILTSCAVIVAEYDTPMNFNSSTVVLIDDVAKCTFVEKIIPKRKIWSDRGKDITRFEIDRLKAMAFRGGGNVISNIIIISPNNPIGYADSFKCSSEIFNEFKSNQDNSDFIKKIITIKYD